MSPAARLPPDDLDLVLDGARDDLATLEGARLFVTGGTGFVGTWLLESLLWANDRLGLGASVVVVTREIARFRRTRPHISSSHAVSVIQGDVRELEAPAGRFDAAIIGATAASAELNETRPLDMIDTIVTGTRRTLEVVSGGGSIPVLLTSSGAVYGRQPPELSHMAEEYSGGPDQLDVRSAYHEGKRLAELLCATYAQEVGLQCKIARLFAFVGPHLPLDRHFAIGNFIGDVLAGHALTIKGDGTPVRSYLYAADMAVWLWRVLVGGSVSRAYNVGSEHPVSIAETAAAVAAAVEPRPPITILGKRSVDGLPERYVPSTRRAPRRARPGRDRPT